MSDITESPRGVQPKVGSIKRRLIRRCIAITIITQLIVIIAVAAIYTSLYNSKPTLAYSLTVIITVVVEVLATLITIDILASPLDEIARAISTVSKENADVYPPNPNNLHCADRQAVAKAVSFLYEMADKQQYQTEHPDIQTNETAVELLRILPVGIIALDNNFNIVAQNSLAPISYIDGQRFIQLDFSNNGQSLEQWFYKSRDQSISVTQTWTRIQNVPSGSLEPRHVYDVVASYHQHQTGNANLIVITIDRTADYVDSEDDLGFVALAAHELRGPVTVIRGYLEMLDEEIYDKSTKEQRQLLDRLNVSARRLASYINNVLNANRYDRRHLKLKLKEMNLSDIIDDISGDLDLRASTVNRHLDWRVPSNLPTVAADSSSIGEVITNLVDNAIKYSHAGGHVTITAKQSGNFVAVSVIDNGIGIAHSATDHLFTKFYRSHRSSASIGGTGIGLYISRAIVESHGGEIGVDSVEGEGSNFTFTLPTYDSVKDKLARDNNSNSEIIKRDRNLIKNHGTIKE